MHGYEISCPLVIVYALENIHVERHGDECRDLMVKCFYCQHQSTKAEQWCCCQIHLKVTLL